MTKRRSMTALLPLAALCAAAAVRAQAPTAPEVPEAIKAPAGERLLLSAHATGAQIYTCGRGSDGQLQWTLKAPEAELRDDQGTVIAHHYAGPAWKYSDGSEVTGKAAARVDSPDGSIPWLRLVAVSHSGAGLFARVSTIQRIHTSGGQPPAAAECGPARESAEVKVPYSADYLFYAPAAAAR